MKRYLLARLAEASTLKGMILLVGGLLGYSINDPAASQVADAVALILAGGVGTLFPDKLDGQ